MKNTEIPADRSSWGTTPAIEKTNEEFLKATLENAATSAGDDPVKKKIGDYYAACIDEDAIEKAGIAPTQPLLDQVAKVKDFATAAGAGGVGAIVRREIGRCLRRPTPGGMRARRPRTGGHRFIESSTAAEN